MIPRAPLTTMLLVGCLGLQSAACDFSEQGGPRIEGASEPGELPTDTDDRFSIHSTDGAVKLGLADEVVYMRMSDEMLREVDAEMAAEAEDEGGLAGAIKSAVTGAVSKALRTRISFEHENIRDVRWEEDRLVVELEGGDNAFGDLEVNDDDVEDKFAEEDVRAFAEEWRKIRDAGPIERSEGEGDAAGDGREGGGGAAATEGGPA